MPDAIDWRSDARRHLLRVKSAETDGARFDVAAALARRRNRSLGLMLIRNRLESVGGTLDIESVAQLGTSLRAVIPLGI